MALRQRPILQCQSVPFDIEVVSHRVSGRPIPNGPVTLRIFAESREGKKDINELKLFNLGGGWTGVSRVQIVETR